MIGTGYKEHRPGVYGLTQEEVTDEIVHFDTTGSYSYTIHRWRMFYRIANTLQPVLRGDSTRWEVTIPDDTRVENYLMYPREGKSYVAVRGTPDEIIVYCYSYDGKTERDFTKRFSYLGPKTKEYAELLNGIEQHFQTLDEPGQDGVS